MQLSFQLRFNILNFLCFVFNFVLKCETKGQVIWILYVKGGLQFGKRLKNNRFYIDVRVSRYIHGCAHQTTLKYRKIIKNQPHTLNIRWNIVHAAFTTTVYRVTVLLFSFTRISFSTIVNDYGTRISHGISHGDTNSYSLNAQILA